jgi:hypothetical protein
MPVDVFTPINIPSGRFGGHQASLLIGYSLCEDNLSKIKRISLKFVQLTSDSFNANQKHFIESQLF